MAECVEGPACPVVQPTHMVYPVSLHSIHGHKAMHADMLEGHRAVNYAAGADRSPGCVSQASDSGQVNSSLPAFLSLSANSNNTHRCQKS